MFVEFTEEHCWSADRPAYIAAWADTYESNNFTAIFYPVAITDTRYPDASHAAA